MNLIPVFANLNQAWAQDANWVSAVLFWLCIGPMAFLSDQRMLKITELHEQGP